MSDQYICISCWQEFTVSPEELAKGDGKVVCPRCGYVQPFQGDASSRSQNPATEVTKLEEPASRDSAMVKEIPWSAVGDSDDIPVGEEERTDRVEIPAGDLEKHGLGHLAFEGEGESAALPWDESGFRVELPDPVSRGEGVLLSRQAQSETTAEDAEATGETPAAADGSAANRGPAATGEPAATGDSAETGESAALDGPTAPSVVDWQLKTPSGLTFKFTDPDAMLGWKKKIATYQQILVSPDGQRWVDFARWVRQYEELGDALKAFMLSETLPDDALPPPKPDETEIEDTRKMDRPAVEALASGEQPAESKGNTTARNGATTQFTFKVMDEKASGFGRYLGLAILGLVLGAGIVIAVLHFTGMLVLPF